YIAHRILRAVKGNARGSRAGFGFGWSANVRGSARAGPKGPGDPPTAVRVCWQRARPVAGCRLSRATPAGTGAAMATRGWARAAAAAAVGVLLAATPGAAAVSAPAT